MGCGTVPINKEEVLKWLPGKSKDTNNEDSLQILNGSCLSLLKVHCGIGLSLWKKTKQRKEVKKYNLASQLLH